MGSLRNVSISGVQATGADDVGCSITGLADHPVENVTLRDVRLGFAGGGTSADASRSIPEKGDAYPEYSMFGKLPSYGLYCRHARSVVFDQVEVSFSQPEARPGLWCEDVDQLQVVGWDAAAASGEGALLRLENAREALIHGCRAPRGSRVYLRVGGRKTAGIRLEGNDLGFAETPVETAREVSAGAVTVGAPGL
jgi:hypothetical protein